MKSLTATALGAALVLTAMAALLASTPADAEKVRKYKYTVAQCNAAYSKCIKWCQNNRSGSEYDKCIENCTDYYATCMGARSRGVTRPGINSPDLAPPVNRSP